MQNSVMLSAPFFSKVQMSKVLKIEKALKNNPTVSKIYSPRFDQRGSGYNPRTQTYEWANWIYRQDILDIKYADVLLLVTDFDGDDTDSGSSYEAGYAKALGKPVIDINLDHNAVNLMLVVGADNELRSVSDVRNHDFTVASSWQYKDPIYGLLAKGSKDGSDVQKDVKLKGHMHK